MHTELDAPRFLEDAGSNVTAPVVITNSTQALKDSLRVYGSMFICSFTVYCYLRKRIHIDLPSKDVV